VSESGGRASWTRRPDEGLAWRRSVPVLLPVSPAAAESAHDEPTRPAEYEEMFARFEGGPFDGERIPLKVVRTSRTEHDVLASSYERRDVAAQLMAATKALEQA